MYQETYIFRNFKFCWLFGCCSLSSLLHTTLTCITNNKKFYFQIRCSRWKFSVRDVIREFEFWQLVCFLFHEIDYLCFSLSLMTTSLKIFTEIHARKRGFGLSFRIQDARSFQNLFQTTLLARACRSWITKNYYEIQSINQRCLISTWVNMTSFPSVSNNKKGNFVWHSLTPKNLERQMGLNFDVGLQVFQEFWACRCMFWVQGIPLQRLLKVEIKGHL